MDYIYWTVYFLLSGIKEITTICVKVVHLNNLLRILICSIYALECDKLNELSGYIIKTSV